jgi:hypothetical protein
MDQVEQVKKLKSEISKLEKDSLDSKINKEKNFSIYESRKQKSLQEIEKTEQKSCHFVPNNNDYCIINYNIDDYPKIDIDRKFTHDDWIKVKWPLYSIRPSINRVKDYKIGLFLINPEYWPLKFEIEFGERWMRNNNIKGIFIEGPVIRKKTHVSTYR